MKTAALNTGSDFHLLDHIAPLASLNQIPLIVTEEHNLNLAKRYYPDLEIRYRPNLESEFKEIGEEFDGLIECKYWLPHLKALFRDLYRKEMKLIFCPHGQSDKGFQTPLLAPYAFQDIVLIYGDLMIEMLKELQIWPQIKAHIRVGNYRFAYYSLHKQFYDDLAEKEIFSGLSRTKPTLLYAPTWKDADGATSFFDQMPNLLQELPSDWNLIVKVHPLLEQREPARFYSLSHQVEKRKDTRLVLDFPPVYPILAKVDAYLGDYSSVGYDFLAFEKPMFFLPQPSQLPGRLHQCGKPVEIRDISLENPFIEKQRNLYRFAYSEHQLFKSQLNNRPLYRS